MLTPYDTAPWCEDSRLLRPDGIGRLVVPTTAGAARAVAPRAPRRDLAADAMVAEVLSVAVLVGSGTVAGVLFAVALSVVPALVAMPPDRYVYAHKLLGRRWDPTMPVIVLGSTGLDLLLAAMAPTAASRASFLLAALLLGGVAVVSHYGNVPINRRLRAVDPERLPPDWQDPRPSWRRWHLLRTALAVAALTVNAAAVTIR